MDSIVAEVGMLNRVINSEQSAIGIRLREFSAELHRAPPLISGAAKLFFLCGANQPSGAASVRRHAIKRFIENRCETYRVVYAEHVLNELVKLGHSGNLLDLEHDISRIADSILIVLESPSAFCELGAFSHVALRNKLIIINDEKFASAQSFINLGPIAAAKSANSPVFVYPMRSPGLEHIDGIGKVFNDLSMVLDVTSSPRHSAIREKLSDLDANKSCMYFAHDLVALLGPVSYPELIDALKVIFGPGDYKKFARLLGILIAARFVETFGVDGKPIYRSALSNTFLKYRTNTNSLIAACRQFHLKKNPLRFVHAGSN